MCIFNTVEKQSVIGFIVDVLFGNFAYLHKLNKIVELHTNFVLLHFESQPYTDFTFSVYACNARSHEMDGIEFRFKARIRIPDQPSKRNMKKIFLLRRFPLSRFLAKTESK